MVFGRNDQPKPNPPRAPEPGEKNSPLGKCMQIDVDGWKYGWKTGLEPIKEGLRNQP
jgi:hypothetical protein